MGLRPGTPKSPNSGRKRGSIDRAQRLLLTEKMAGDIMRVYQRLGGVKWLLEFAQDNPAEFLRQGLSRLFPPPQKPEGEPDFQLNQQINLQGNPAEIARRVAFALAAGLDAQGKDPVVERDVPYSQIAREEESPFTYPPGPDPERERWAKEASLSPEERLNAETLDEHVNRKAFADSSPAPVVQRVRTPVRMKGRRGDELL